MNNAISTLQTLAGQALRQGRKSLLEPEVYAVLQAAGLAVPDHEYLRCPALGEVSDRFRGRPVVVKVVSSEILHKTEVGGVRFASGKSLTREWLEQFLAGVAGRFRRQYERDPQVDGVLIAERIDQEASRLASEIIVGLKWSSDFGFVGMVGLGGLKAELLGSGLPWGEGNLFFSPSGCGPAEILREVSRTLSYRDLAGQLRGSDRVLEDMAWLNLFEFLRDVARHFPLIGGGAGEPAVMEMEFNPMVVDARGRLVPLDALLRLEQARPGSRPRPIHKLHHLFRPRSIALAGVSGKAANMGRIILSNLLRDGFTAENLYLIKPGETEMDGVRCYSRPADLPIRTDLTVLAVGASTVPALVEELIAHRKTESIILIPGGMAEKAGGEAIQKKVEDLVQASRATDWQGPLICGPNSMGIRSVPGACDTTFIPENKFPHFKGAVRNVAYVSQSGAFMLSRISDLPHLEPLYLVSVGNQMDLTISDYVSYIRDDDSVRVIAVYVEGFQPGDGLQFLQQSRAAIARGKSVVLYKGGRTTEGQGAARGHTAALAGEYRVAWELARTAGVMVAESMQEFEDLLKLVALLSGRKVLGKRVALMSNAGFQTVAMADHLRERNAVLELAPLGEKTLHELRQALSGAGIDTLINVTNPLDLTPSATDGIYMRCIRALLEDPSVDALLVGVIPFSPVMSTLESSPNAQELLTHPESLAVQLPRLMRETDRVLVAAVEAGRSYDPLVRALEAGGVPVFRACDAAVQALGKYLTNRVQTAPQT